MWRIFLAICTLATCTLAFGIADDALAGPSRVAVLPLRHTGVEADLIPTLTAVLCVELEKIGRFDVIAPRDIESLIDFERQREDLICDEACVAEVGGALGAQRIIDTHIGRLGRSYVLNMSLIHVGRARTEARTYEMVRDRPEEVIALVRRSVRDLVRQRAPRARAPLAEARDVDADHLPSHKATATQPARAAPTVSAEANFGAALGWLTAGAGAAVLIGGGVLHHIGSSEGRNGVQLTGDVLIGVGSAATLAGLFWAAWGRVADTETAGDELSVAPLVSGGFVGAGLAVGF